MSYYRVPEEVYDDREKAAVWARRAYEVAVKQGSDKKEENNHMPRSCGRD